MNYSDLFPFYEFSSIKGEALPEDDYILSQKAFNDRKIIYANYDKWEYLFDDNGKLINTSELIKNGISFISSVMDLQNKWSSFLHPLFFMSGEVLKNIEEMSRKELNSFSIGNTKYVLRDDIYYPLDIIKVGRVVELKAPKSEVLKELEFDKECFAQLSHIYYAISIKISFLEKQLDKLIQRRDKARRNEKYDEKNSYNIIILNIESLLKVYKCVLDLTVKLLEIPERLYMFICDLYDDIAVPLFYKN